MKNTLYYFVDPMCSTCYGYTKELTRIREQLNTKIDFEIIVGGLRPHGTETIKEMKSFLTDQWLQIQQQSEVEFNYNILDTCNLKYDTEPACRAVVTMKKLKPNLVFDYLKAIQKGFYFHNYSPNEPATFALQAKEFGVQLIDFLEAFNSNEIKELTKAEFAFAKKCEIKSLPSLAIEQNGDLMIVAQGIVNHELVLKRINSFV
ncbi:MAG: DsbA family protein [Bacteroidia bacterium]